MLASILLPLAESPQSAHAQDYAFWLAKKCGGRVQGLAIIDVKSFEIPVLGTADGLMPSVVSPPVAESRALLEELTRMAGNRADRFARAGAEGGVSCSTEVRTGIPSDVIAQESIAHDLVIMARSGYGRAPKSDEAQVDSLVSAVIRSSIRPVLVAGRAFPASGAIRSMIVAFDGSVHAARALSVAAELGAGLGLECLLATIAPAEEVGEEILAPAAAFLRHHGVLPKKKIVVGSKPSEWLCGIASEAGSNILIMGAYGHSPIREVLFGSTTERVLNHCDATVILQS
jgi:nucleotide-binding universal stress UspA family protein